MKTMEIKVIIAFVRQCGLVFFAELNTSLAQDNKAIYNCTMPYFIALMMISSEVLDNLKNNLTDLWPERNSMALNKIMLNI